MRTPMPRLEMRTAPEPRSHLQYPHHVDYVFVFFGSILEGDATLLTAAFLAHGGRMRLSAVIFTAGLASTLFNEFLFHAARRRGRAYLEKRAESHRRYRGVQEWVRRRAVVLLLFSRYVFGFRMAIPIACGAVGMRPAVFLGLNLAGALLWAIPIAYLGYFFGNVLEGFWSELRNFRWHIATAMIVVITALLAWLDPELRRFVSLVTRSREAAVRSSARARRLLSRVSPPAEDRSRAVCDDADRRTSSST